MKLTNILNFPAIYKDRAAKLKEISLHSLNIKIKPEENSIYITGEVNKYVTKIILKDLIIKPNTKILVDCTCDSFKYEFSRAINKDNSLINNLAYGLTLTNIPKSKNIYQHISGCKHLIYLGQYIFHRKNLIERKVKNVGE